MPEAHVEESVNRCAEAFHREHSREEACRAFLAELPILSSPANIHAYLACIGEALSLGVIDLLDLGRYCHLAQIAMRAWKMAQSDSEKAAHPLPPNSNHIDAGKTSGAPESALSLSKGPRHLGTGEGRQTPNHPSADPKNTHPLPHNGNLSEEEVTRIAISVLPDFEMQKHIFKVLRQNGVAMPSNSHLRKHPAKALHYVCMAKPYFEDPQPAQPDQAA